MLARVVVVLVFLTGALLALPSFAAPTAADAKLAEALFNAGKDAMSRNDLASACARFAESLKLDPAVGTRLNLAACEEKSGKLASALDHFTQARADLPKDDFRIPFTADKIASLTKRVARIIVRAPRGGPPPGTRVLRDGVEVPAALFNTPINVDPGPHVVVIEIAGRTPEKNTLNVGEGEERTVDVRSEAPPPAVTPIPVEPPPPSPTTAPPKKEEKLDDAGGDPRRALAFVTGGLGIAGIATGAVTGIIAINAASTYKDHCTDGICDPEGLDAAATGRSVRIVSPVAFAVGAAFGAASVYLFLTSRNRSSARIAPVVTPFGGGLGVLGTF